MTKLIAVGVARVRGVSRLARARLGYAAGCAAAFAGVGLQFGLGVALIAGGVVTAASFLLLAETEPETNG